jgi:hypothetical protein
MVSSTTIESQGSLDAWMVLNNSKVESFGAIMPLIVVEISYQFIHLAFVDTS